MAGWFSSLFRKYSTAVNRLQQRTIDVFYRILIDEHEQYSWSTRYGALIGLCEMGNNVEISSSIRWTVEHSFFRWSFKLSFLFSNDWVNIFDYCWIKRSLSNSAKQWWWARLNASPRRLSLLFFRNSSPLPIGRFEPITTRTRRNFRKTSAVISPLWFNINWSYCCR